MGDQRVSKFSDPLEKRSFARNLLNDIRALEYMLDERLIESGITRIGAEQELCLVGDDWRPSLNNLQLLEEIADPHFTTEIARFNLEINLDPQSFKHDCFSRMEHQLNQLLKKAKKVAGRHNTKIMLTGILPTLQQSDLSFENMTPNPRYEALNDIIRAQRNGDFEVNIHGLDDLITKHPNILFEACNTSFQVHLQVDQDDFQSMYNWAQSIAGPVLAACANSPLLMGKRLWSETRIALFQQSVDTRDSNIDKREQEPRVSFGKQWLHGSVADLFKDQISRYNLLFASELKEDAMEQLRKGSIPELNALKMHNSTVYSWNRACYGVGGGKPHLRIENRYLPAGPTSIDEIANAAFWLGLMKGMPAECADMPAVMSFEDVRYNFYNAARTGMDSQFRWMGQSFSAAKLIEEELLPLAYKGLNDLQVDPVDIERLLSIIENRTYRHLNGAQWMMKNYSELLIGSTPSEASISLTKGIYQNEDSEKPVHLWEDVDPEKRDTYKEFKTVGQIMTTDMFTVNEDELLDLVTNVMDWKRTPYVPVENDNSELTGVITYQVLLRHFLKNEGSSDTPVKEIMLHDYQQVNPEMSTADAVDIMARERTGVLMVTRNKKLLGIVTESDIIQVAKMTGRFK